MPHKPYVIVWPDEEAIQGIYIAGHCIAPRGRLSSNSNAHAHCMQSDKERGWICCRPNQVPRLGTLADEDTDVPYIVKPGMLALHELAHVLCAESGHGFNWRRSLVMLSTRYPDMTQALEDEAERYITGRKASKVQAAGHFLIGQRVQVAAHTRPIALRGEIARVVKVGNTRLTVEFERASELGKWARYTYWPAGSVKPIDD